MQDVSYTHISQLQNTGTKHYNSVHVFWLTTMRVSTANTSSVTTTTKNGKAKQLHIKSAAYLKIKVN